MDFPSVWFLCPGSTSIGQCFRQFGDQAHNSDHFSARMGKDQALFQLCFLEEGFYIVLGISSSLGFGLFGIEKKPGFEKPLFRKTAVTGF